MIQPLSSIQERPVATDWHARGLTKIFLSQVAVRRPRSRRWARMLSGCSVCLNEGSRKIQTREPGSFGPRSPREIRQDREAAETKTFHGCRRTAAGIRDDAYPVAPPRQQLFGLRRWSRCRSLSPGREIGCRRRAVPTIEKTKQRPDRSGLALRPPLPCLRSC